MPSLRTAFDDLVAKSTADQTEHFLKSFVFELGDSWKDVVALQDTFEKYLSEKAERHDLDCVQAAELLQKEGRTRTAIQRKNELKDIDLDQNGRICFTEYLLLHYKVLILRAYFQRKEMQPSVSLDNDGVGLVGVGDLLLEELFTMPEGLSGELQAAIEEFMHSKNARCERIAELQEKVNLGGVKGLTAKNELAQLDMADMTEINRIELTLAAAKRRSKKESGSEELARRQAAEQRAAEQARLESRKKLMQRAAMFDNQ